MKKSLLKTHCWLQTQGRLKDFTVKIPVKYKNCGEIINKKGILQYKGKF